MIVEALITLVMVGVCIGALCVALIGKHKVGCSLDNCKCTCEKDE
tara:strand:+ start:94 stop:228 length:135 start_codon:yes stop_codon:yes gene_type:complete